MEKDACTLLGNLLLEGSKADKNYFGKDKGRLSFKWEHKNCIVYKADIFKRKKEKERERKEKNNREIM